MGVERKTVSFVPVLQMVLFLMASSPLVRPARAGQAMLDEQYEAILREVRRAHPNLELPEDHTPTYLVRAAEIAGNTLLSARDLWEDLPVLCVKRSKDPNVPPEAYDFRMLKDVLRAPGELRPVSTRAIKGFTEYLLAQYHERGYAGVYVYVSAKAIQVEDASATDARRLENDLLPFRIIEGHVASVAIRHYDPNGTKKDKGRLKDSLVAKWSPAQPGDPIQTKSLDDFVRLLNDNPDRYVRHSVSTGSEPNSLDLIYALYEADPWHPYAQVDNSGTDQRQWSPRFGFFNTNLTGRDDRASVMYQANVTDPTENYAAFGSYGIPVLTPRLRLSAFGGYSEFDITPEATGGLVSFLGAGSFYGGNLRYNIMQWRGWFLDLTGTASAENSRIHNDLGIDSDVDMRLVGLGFEVRRADVLSSSLVAFERLENVGGSSAEEFAEARTGAARHFAKYSIVASHARYLDEAKRNHLGGSFRAIFADDRLVPAKMTTFGGLYSVRGYPEDVLVADGGILASLEYRRLLVGDLFGAEAGDDSPKKKGKPIGISLLGFTDYGQAQIKDPVPGEIGHQDLWGIGLGTLITRGQNFEARIYYGWALQEIVRPGDGRLLADEGDGAWNFSFLYRW
jgi:hemolysin activation/secretion protein